MLPAAAKQQAAGLLAEARKTEAEIEESVLTCRCRVPFKYAKVADDKYKVLLLFRHCCC